MSLTDSVYVFTFFSGLFGGFGHCIGMCGPVVAAYALQGRGRGSFPHLLYNIGRVTTYSVLGGIIGLAGSFVSVIHVIERFQYGVLAVVGAMMVLMGLAAGRWLPFLNRIEDVPWLSRGIHEAVRFIAGAKTIGAYFPMGLVLGFLPCGLLYTVLLAAAGVGAVAGNPAEGFLKGMALLLLFGSGTVPALFLVGQIVSVKGEQIRERLSRISAVLMIAVGLLFLFRALR